mmetsp:Transcript_125240/g.217065  ORF Transcript_125240/g.217065 Transcript_125240/m.217065 type:complete len:107 (+) Transcript_125240:2034-2354(+)
MAWSQFGRSPGIIRIQWHRLTLLFPQSDHRLGVITHAPEALHLSQTLGTVRHYTKHLMQFSLSPHPLSTISQTGVVCELPWTGASMPPRYMLALKTGAGQQKKKKY